MTSSRPVAGFFAVDARNWAHACRLGLNAAVSYLVLASFTRRDNQTTIAGVQAIETYTGIGRLRAKKSLETLQKAGLLSSREGHTWRVLPACEVPGTTAFPRPLLTAVEESVVEKVKQGAYLKKPERCYANEAVKKGHLIHVDASYRLAAPPEPTADLIWLPNALVGGAAEETPPVELLRQTGDVATLRLFIDLYRVHNLSDDAGIHWRCIREEYKRQEIFSCGELIIFVFELDETKVFVDAPFVTPFLKRQLEQFGGGQRDVGMKDFWRSWSKLRQLRLFEFVPHLVENDSDAAEVIHACAKTTGEQIERDLGAAAYRAALAMLSPECRGRFQRGIDVEQLPSDFKDNPVMLVPVQAHLDAAQMYGIARLRYRPHTSSTTRWLADLHEKAPPLVARFGELSAKYGDMAAGAAAANVSS